MMDSAALQSFVSKAPTTTHITIINRVFKNIQHLYRNSTHSERHIILACVANTLPLRCLREIGIEASSRQYRKARKRLTATSDYRFGLPEAGIVPDNNNINNSNSNSNNNNNNNNQQFPARSAAHPPTLPTRAPQTDLKLGFNWIFPNIKRINTAGNPIKPKFQIRLGSSTHAHK